MHKILVKWPTRERPQQFLKGIEKYNNHASHPEHITYLITCDKDDPRRALYENISKTIKDIVSSEVVFIFGPGNGKIHAVNRDMEAAPVWDIGILASDDMVVQVKGWDETVRNDFTMLRGNKDGTLREGVMWYDDGFNTDINCMPVMTKSAYDRFGYWYSPEYKSLWCDNEFTDVWRILGKMNRSERVLFQHQHYARDPKFSSQSIDALMKRNESYYQADEQVYRQRKSRNFDLTVTA